MSLTRQQVDALLKPIHPSRVLRDNKGMSHVSQQDIRAHLTRIFGFGGWSSNVIDLTLVREAPGVGKDGKDKGWAVTYRCTLRLTVRDPDGQEIASYEDVATGTSPNLPTLGDAHDFACKVAVSMALKRAATNLGDPFGLSLYNKGQTAALVIGTLVLPDGDGADASDRVPQQQSMGHDDAGSAEPATPPVPSPEQDERQHAKAELWKFARSAGYDSPVKLASDFAGWSSGLALSDAPVADLHAFTEWLMREAATDGAA